MSDIDPSVDPVFNTPEAVALADKLNAESADSKAYKGSDGTRDDIKQAATIQRRMIRSATRGNLQTANLIVRSIEREITDACRSNADIVEFRDQTIGLFSAPLSRVTGTALTAKKLDEFVTIHYLGTLIPNATDEGFDRISWDNLRTLARWAVYQPGESYFIPGEHNTVIGADGAETDAFTPGEYYEQWMVKDGCEDALLSFVRRLGKRPMPRKDLAKAMDAVEAGLNGIDSVEDAGTTLKEKTRFLTTITRTMVKLGWDRERFLTILTDERILDLPTLDTVATRIMDAEKAKQPARRPGLPLDSRQAVKPGSSPLRPAGKL